MRTVYKLLSIWGDLRAARRGPGPYARRQGRKRANRIGNRWLRR